jgi:sarcosine oxidase
VARYDTVICGLGVMGCAALYALARRGQRVLGIERFVPGHDRGSSHGKTRIIRLSYFEHPSYVPLVRRAYELWREIETAATEKLLHVTGIVEIGLPDGTLVKGTLASARMHTLAHEVMDAGALMRRFPAFRLPSEFVGVVQPDGGFLEAEASVAALLRLAMANGAEVHTDETVRAIEPRRGAARVVTSKDTVEAGTAIVTAGPWAKTLVPELPLRVTRQVMAWFAPSEPRRLARSQFPVFLIESRHGVHYGFPTDGHDWVKVAKHRHDDEIVDPDSYDRSISSADETLIRAVLANFIPAANGVLRDAKTCLYTETPDGDFLIDCVPGAPQIIVASPCSGHGFKFAPVIGEILADLATKGGTRHDISRFSLGRFGSGA